MTRMAYWSFVDTDTSFCDRGVQRADYEKHNVQIWTHRGEETYIDWDKIVICWRSRFLLRGQRPIKYLLQNRRAPVNLETGGVNSPLEHGTVGEANVDVLDGRADHCTNILLHMWYQDLHPLIRAAGRRCNEARAGRLSATFIIVPDDTSRAIRSFVGHVLTSGSRDPSAAKPVVIRCRISLDDHIVSLAACDHDAVRRIRDYGYEVARNDLQSVPVNAEVELTVDRHIEDPDKVLLAVFECHFELLPVVDAVPVRAHVAGERVSSVDEEI